MERTAFRRSSQPRKIAADESTPKPTMKRFILPVLTAFTAVLIAAGQASASDRCYKSHRSQGYSHGHSHYQSYQRSYCPPPVQYYRPSCEPRYYSAPACPPPVQYYRPPCGSTRTFSFSSPGFGIFFRR